MCHIEHIIYILYMPHIHFESEASHTYMGRPAHTVYESYIYIYLCTYICEASCIL